MAPQTIHCTTCHPYTSYLFFWIHEQHPFAENKTNNADPNALIEPLLTIADEYQGLPVKSIYKEAFMESNITAVTIPGSVTTIGNRAFAYCSSLTSAVFGDILPKI